MSRPNAKGTNFRSLMTALERARGRRLVHEVFEALPPEIAEPLQSGALISSGWYPVAWYAQLHATIHDVTGEGPELSFELGRRAARADFEGIYRILAMVLTPQGIMKRGPRIFGTYYDVGSLEIVAADKNRAQAIVRDCEHFDAALWADFEGGTVGVIEACGGKDVTVRRLRGSPGDPLVELEIRWS